MFFLGSNAFRNIPRGEAHIPTFNGLMADVEFNSQAESAIVNRFTLGVTLKAKISLLTGPLDTR